MLTALPGEDRVALLLSVEGNTHGVACGAVLPLVLHATTLPPLIARFCPATMLVVVEALHMHRPQPLAAVTVALVAHHGWPPGESTVVHAEYVVPLYVNGK